MKHIKRKIERWTQEGGYKRGIILPFLTKPYPDVQVQLTVIEAGNEVLKHYHVEQTEFIYFLEGACDFIFENKKIKIESGDLLIIEPNEEHSANNVYNSDACFLTFKIHGNPDDTIWSENS